LSWGCRQGLRTCFHGVARGAGVDHHSQLTFHADYSMTADQIGL
jgi:hypothetical protein